MAAAIMRNSLSPSERRRITIARQEEILEAMIWAGANLAVPDIVASSQCAAGKVPEASPLTEKPLRGGWRATSQILDA